MEGKHVHLNRSAVGEVSALDIKALAGVTVGVDAVAATRGLRGGRGGRTATEVPFTVDDTGVIGAAGSTSEGEEVEKSRREVKTAIRASRALE